ncbi:TetR/AcrR family transcriptional regulator [Pseudorhodoferax soli]|uniref:TetR family transcriptional regulator n=1 Tax=Pseudorhodoferax soli TaxID=545864 RepID=A0A368X9G8_9BURK|nr:TetR/AcrR family transcriptional regulator [Pseudorhodoferax soli]RCW63638.1 TetR family transcriptional regulator [Pseudorhodoferax soli]
MVDVQDAMDLTPARREILEAAADCFMEQGFHATSIDVVARRMGATKGRVYHHYQSKMDLFFDVHRLGMQLLFEAVEPASRAPGDAVQVLGGMMRAHALALFEHHAFESVVVQGVHLHRFGATTPAQRKVLDELIASRDCFEQLFRQQLELGQQQGLVAAVSPSIAVKTLLGGLQWSLVWYRPERGDGAAHRERLADAMVHTLVDGLRARAVAPTVGSRTRRRRAV